MGFGTYMKFVIFAPRTRCLGYCLLHTKVRKSQQNGFCAKTAQITIKQSLHAAKFVQGAICH